MLETVVAVQDGAERPASAAGSDAGGPEAALAPGAVTAVVTTVPLPRALVTGLIDTRSGVPHFRHPLALFIPRHRRPNSLHRLEFSPRT